MKTRSGFISNSSSTSFTFFLKSDKLEEVFTLMRKYAQYFELYDIGGILGDYSSCSVEDIIKSMENISSKLQIKDIFSLRVENEKELLDIIDEQKLESDKFFNQMYIDQELEIARKKILLGKIERIGLKNYLKIDFGDNDGDVQGGLVGNLMDYEGRHINIKKPDFVVITEQNR